MPRNILIFSFLHQKKRLIKKKSKHSVRFCSRTVLFCAVDGLKYKGMIKKNKKWIEEREENHLQSTLA